MRRILGGRADLVAEGPAPRHDGAIRVGTCVGKGDRQLVLGVREIGGR